MGIAEESLAFHYEKKGKLEVVSTVSVSSEKDLSLAYTQVNSPGTTCVW